MKRRTVKNATSPTEDGRQSSSAIVRELLTLSHELGREDRGMAILGEGNTSARLDAGRFLVKASGSSLKDLSLPDLVECRSDALLALLDAGDIADNEVEKALLGARIRHDSRKPSVEAVFHAYCLSLDGIAFVGHTHARAVNALLCSERAQEFAQRRIFPDEIVCCGPESVYIPYTDPGIRLAREVRSRTDLFIQRHGHLPRVILIQNHGIITIGRTSQGVLAAMLMAEKAAMIWTAAAALGGPTFLSAADVDRIANRTDEHLRRQRLNI